MFTILRDKHVDILLSDKWRTSQHLPYATLSLGEHSGLVEMSAPSWREDVANCLWNKTHSLLQFSGVPNTS